TTRIALLSHSCHTIYRRTSLKRLHPSVLKPFSTVLVKVVNTMSNQQDPKNIENEPKPADELASEELDQVVGGTGPGGAGFLAPSLPTTSAGPQKADGQLDAGIHFKYDLKAQKEA